MNNFSKRIKQERRKTRDIPMKNDKIFSNMIKNKTLKTRKYQQSYLLYGFTNKIEMPHCLIYSKSLSSESMKQHIETLHPECMKKS